MMMIIISLICIWSSTLAFTNRFQSCYHPQSRQCQHVKMMMMMVIVMMTIVMIMMAIENDDDDGDDDDCDDDVGN